MNNLVDQSSSNTKRKPMFKSDVEKAKERKFKEKLYNEVAQELHQGKRHDAVWTKALADAVGNSGVAQGLYIEYRVQSIMDDLIISQDDNKNRIQHEHKIANKAIRDENNSQTTNIFKKIFGISFSVIITIVVLRFMGVL